MKNFLAALFICLCVPAGALAFSLDLPGAYFKPGHPTAGESLRDSLDPSRADESIKNLRLTAESLAKYPGVYFEVAGHADSNECEADECRYLSSRRARLVFRHLLHLGVDPTRLDGLQGYGTKAPVSDHGSEETWMNRRVEINVSN